eukprot:15761269-Heterocapsa_arctica.AAC.1
MVRFLCEAGAYKDKAGRYGHTPLTLASVTGHLQVARYLCEAGSDKDKAERDGHTPLALASARGHLEVARFLCEAGADQNNGGPQSETLSRRAAEASC